MGRKGRQRSRSSKTVARDKFPIGTLSRRRKMLSEECISSSKVYKEEQKKFKKLKRKAITFFISIIWMV